MVIEEQNRQQIGLMREQLNCFIQGRMELAELITELEVFLSRMDKVEAAWKNACFEKINRLASIYAEAVSKKSSELGSQREESLVQTIYDLIKLTTR